MRSRDPEAKKKQLLDAALVEFAEHGLAGTPVDVIARRATCSPGLVYTYFGSKEGLFDAVLDDIARRTSDDIPIDVTDLPGYAVRLHDANHDHPDVTRFVAWHQLERVDASRAGATKAIVDGKIAEIAGAQDRGEITSDMPASLLLLAVQSIARMWVTEPDDVLAAIDPTGDPELRRDSVRRAVAHLVGVEG